MKDVKEPEERSERKGINTRLGIWPGNHLEEVDEARRNRNDVKCNPVVRKSDKNDFRSKTGISGDLGRTAEQSSKVTAASAG